MSDHSYTGNWTPDLSFGNWSTAVDTRSLSFCLLSKNEIGDNSTLESALLFYENPTGKISALLQRMHLSVDTIPKIEWIDITSQASKSLPDAFREGPSSINSSSTLYESDSHATFSAPFTCTVNSSGSAAQLVFYSPNAKDPIASVHYSSDGSGNYSFGKGMYCLYSNP